MAALDDTTHRDPSHVDSTTPGSRSVVTGPLAAPPTHATAGRSHAVPVVLGIIAVAAIAAAVLGWTRDPSKNRAVQAEAHAGELDTSLRTTSDELAATKAALAQRTGELTAANAQITKMATVSAAQVQGARLPKTFALTGGVAPGSCSLTGEACNVTTTVRNLTLSCAETHCDCTNGSCTITSDLWKTPVPLAYDAGAGRYSASGNLDADLFRCAGVPQPTTFELRLRATAATWNAETWVASALGAELAQASQATDCLAGNRTYALTGPAA